MVQRDKLKRKRRGLAEQREAAERELSACRGRGEHIRHLEDLREFYAREMLPDLLENQARVGGSHYRRRLAGELAEQLYEPLGREGCRTEAART